MFFEEPAQVENNRLEAERTLINLIKKLPEQVQADLLKICNMHRQEEGVQRIFTQAQTSDLTSRGLSSDLQSLTDVHVGRALLFVRFNNERERFSFKKPLLMMAVFFVFWLSICRSQILSPGQEKTAEKMMWIVLFTMLCCCLTEKGGPLPASVVQFERQARNLVAGRRLPFIDEVADPDQLAEVKMEGQENAVPLLEPSSGQSLNG